MLNLISNKKVYSVTIVYDTGKCLFLHSIPRDIVFVLRRKGAAGTGLFLDEGIKKNIPLLHCITVVRNEEQITNTVFLLFRGLLSKCSGLKFQIC